MHNDNNIYEPWEASMKNKLEGGNESAVEVSDRVWSGIDAALPPEKKNNRLFWMILLSVFVAGFALFVFNRSSIDLKNTDVKQENFASTIKGEQQKALNESNSISVSTNDDDVTTKATDKIIDPKIIASSNAVYNKPNSEKIILKNQIANGQNNSEVKDLIKEEINSNNLPKALAERPVATNLSTPGNTNSGSLKDDNTLGREGLNSSSPIDNLTTKSIERISAPVNLIDYLFILPLNTLASITREEENLPQVQIEVVRVSHPDLVKERRAMRIYAGVNTSEAHLNSDYGQAVEPFDFYQSQKVSYQLGVDFTHQLKNRLWLSGGLSYQKLQSESGHNTELNYDRNSETLDQNLLVSNDRQSFATPYGSVEGDVAVSRSPLSDPGNIQILHIDLAMQQSFSRLSVPLFMEYYLIQKPKWSASFALGGQVSYTYSHHTTLQDAAVTETTFSNHNSSVVADQLNDFSPWGVGLRAGLYINYQIFNNGSLFINPNFTRDITSSFNANSFNTTTSTYSGNIGLKFFLK